MARLLHFTHPDGREYVVINEDTDVEPEEFVKPGFEFRIGNTVELGDLDIGRFPCDRTLTAE